MHKQTTIKVNAQVDDKIVKLVKALNSFPNVLTLDSCQGDKNQEYPYCNPYVFFCCTTEIETISFITELIKALRNLPHSLNSVDIRLEWNNLGEPLGQIIIKDDYLTEVVKLLSTIRLCFPVATDA